MEEKIGIFGGSFDPIHLGHLNIAKSAYEEFDLDEVWFVPAGHSPNKNEKQMTPAESRAEMVSLAIEGTPYFKLCDIEMASEKTSYTYITLTKLKEQYPDKKFYFIMGADSLDYFDRWYHPEIICQKAVILAAVRDDMDIAAIREKIAQIQSLFPAEIYPVFGGKTDISSTILRQKLSEGEENSLAMLPEKVRTFIKEQKLYDAT